jgi:hypothetical protein
LAIEETTRGAALTASLLDVLSVPIVQGLMSVRSESSGPFAVVFRTYEHAKFVAVLRGRFDLQIEGAPTPTRVRRGDCYMLTNGMSYRIFNANVPETDAATLYSADRRMAGTVRWGDGVADTVTVGSRVIFSPEGTARIRERLPPLIRIPAGTAEAVRFRAILTLLCGDPEGAPGAAFAADRYVGILLVQVVRHLLYITSCP